MLRYVCLSDLHAGAPTSLLMNLPDDGVLRPPSLSPVTKGFVEIISALLGTDDQPQLILLGDVLDLQFSDKMYAYQNGRGFLAALADTGCFAPDVMATAGNHDHAFWTDARLSMDLAAMAAGDVPERATPAFSPQDQARSRVLDTLIKDAGFGAVDFRYPNIGLHHEKRAVLLHHGHFFEEPYRMISTLRDFFADAERVDITVADVACENAGWIDFLWGSVGDAGLSEDASELYQNMLTSVGFRRISADLARLLSTEMAEHMPLSGDLRVKEALRVAARVILDVIVGKFRDTERYTEVEAFTAKGRDGFAWFMEGPTKAQIKDELGHVPNDLTVVFGHTHKPFAERIVAAGFDAPMKVYNTGGWVLNGPRLDTKEGASIVLIDDDLNVVALRLFTTPKDEKVPLAFLDVLSEPRESMTSFVADLKARLATPAMQDRLARFASTVCQAYFERQAMLLDLTGSESTR